MLKPKQRAQAARTHLTERRIDALPAPAKRKILHDAKEPTLGLRLESSGARVFFWFRAVSGKPTWKRIGNFPDVSLDAARKKAAEYNVALATWQKDGCVGPSPFEATRPSRQPTLHELTEDYINRHTLLYATNPPKAAKIIRRYVVDKYLGDWKERRLGSITRHEVFDLHRKLGVEAGKITANRVCTFLRTVFNWASKAELWRGENPAAKLELFKESKRERYLQPDELVRLKAELDREANADLKDYVTLALTTGQRKANVHGMAWADVDWNTLTWTIQRTKNKKPHTVDLMPVAVATLKARYAKRKDDSPWVFPSFGRSGHVEDFKKPWAALLARAKLKNVTQHDMRRTFASYMAIAGVSLQQIGSALGHLSTASTVVYARLHREAVRNALTAGTERMERMMKTAAKQKRLADRGEKPAGTT
ncbi:MAG: site-specific integrase [Acidobacteriia bacterium]|nr:site-specific integrase [Terriglobia bacterium]